MTLYIICGIDLLTSHTQCTHVAATARRVSNMKAMLGWLADDDHDDDN